MKVVWPHLRQSHLFICNDILDRNSNSHSSIIAACLRLGRGSDSKIIDTLINSYTERLRETSGVRHIVFHENLIWHEKERQ